MAKTPTFPALVSDTFCVDLSVLKDWGLLKPFLKSEGVYNDIRDGYQKGSISFFLDTGAMPYCILSGNYRGIPFENTIKLAVKNSNLIPQHGKFTKLSKIYYFICPITGKRCRKLYVMGAQFGCAKALNFYYSQQIKSKKQFVFEAVYKSIGGLERLMEEKYAPRIRRSYNGKITRRYKALLKREKKLEESLEKMLELSGAFYRDQIEIIEREGGFTTIERTILP